ncbi:MAG: fumarylacetoacetate hydrolase family protein [Thermoplasmata archaeon]
MKFFRSHNEYYIIEKGKGRKINGDIFSFEMQESLIEIPETLDHPYEYGKILLVGKNYYEHIREMNSQTSEKPTFFSKTKNTLIGHNQKILKNKEVKKLDYEIELGIIIGKKGKYIEKKDADDYIFGYTITNDISARDFQYSFNNQWFLGKSMDTFFPTGPYIVTKDEIDDPMNLNLKLRVNDQIRQESNTKNMIFDIFYLISFISTYITLEPGDIISTGTPSGVAQGRGEGYFLKDGDVIEAEIEKIGILKNVVKDYF